MAVTLTSVAGRGGGGEPFTAALLPASPEDGPLSEGSAPSETGRVFPVCPEARVNSDAPVL